MSGEPVRRALVVGSMIREIALTPSGGNPSPLAGRRQQYIRRTAWVGAPTIRTMIHEALEEKRHGTAAPSPSGTHRDAGVPDPDLSPGLTRQCGEVTTVFEYLPKKSPASPRSKRVLRVKASFYATHFHPERTATPPDDLRTYLEQTISEDHAAPIVVVYDRDVCFRNALTSVDTAALGAFRPDPARPLIVAAAGEIDETWIARAIGFFQGPQSDPHQTVVVVTAEGLRRRGLNIIEYGSIEQTAREIVGDMKRAPLATILAQAGHLVVVFEELGLLCIRRTRAGAREGSVHYCPNFDRIAQMDRDTYGHAPGEMAITLTALVRRIAAAGTGPWDLDPGLRLAVAAYNLHFSEGFDPGDPFRTLERTLSLERRGRLHTLEDDDTETGREFRIASLAFPLGTELPTWSRLNALIPPGASPEVITGHLRTIVQAGVEAAFENRTTSPPTGPWFPRSIITCPYLEIGSIKTVHPAEIAGFIALAKLIRKYLQDEAWNTPLSIAVFGPPGSGKSTGVEELVRSVQPAARELPGLTYNLAQFHSVDMLTEAFHQVQDRALSSEDVPLVTFDEFDADFQGRLGWLKYFLSPMQSGTFRGHSAEYRVGRSIFLFAGGTSWTFDEFERPARNPRPEIRSAKLTDFISRLKGHLDVLDINAPTGERPDQAVLRKVRRAMILRSLLTRFAKPIMPAGPAGIAYIDDVVIDAFIEVPRYEHGLRSMEALVRMARWIGGRLMPASFLSDSQLDMHARDFGDLLNGVPAGRQRAKGRTGAHPAAPSRSTRSAPRRPGPAFPSRGAAARS